MEGLYVWIVVFFVLPFLGLANQEERDIFWAQHMVGADLLREELKKSGVMEDDNPTSIIGIWDANWMHHGEYVSQLIAGPRPSAVIPADAPLLYKNLYSGDGREDFIAAYKALYEECRQNRNCPSYINNSMTWGEGRIIPRLASSLSTVGSTLIVSAGNKGSTVEPAKTEASLNKNIIVVASLAPNGFPWVLTNYGEAVTISVPSDKSVRSYDYNGNAEDFGETSSGTPFVTGSLGGFTLLSRYHLSTHQAHLLLKKTAIPIPNLPQQHLMGVGMLNSYKIGMTALKIKDRCQRYSTNPRKNKCLSDALENDETYRFDETSTRLFEEAVNSFPECVASENRPKGGINDCERMEAFNNLRRSFLLNPTDVKTLNAVICVKEKYFESKATDFYRSLVNSLQRDDNEILKNICQNGPFASLSKYLPKFLIIDLIRREECSPKFFRFVAASHVKEAPTQELIEAILDHHPDANNTILLYLSYAIKGHIDTFSNPQRLVEKVLDHPNVNEASLKILSRIPSQTRDISSPGL